MADQIAKTQKRRGCKYLVAFAGGIAATLLYQYFSSPIQRTLVSAKSPDGTYLCVIDEVSAWPWTGPAVDYLMFRIFTADDMQPAEGEPQSIWIEYLSHGRELDIASLRISWSGDIATVSDKYDPALEWDGRTWLAPPAKPASQPAMPATASAGLATRP